MCIRRLTRSRSLQTLGVAALLVLAGARTQAQVLDGGFEDPPEGSNVTNFAAGQTFGAWTVSAGNIDLVTNGLWQPHGGAQSVDLSGNTAGTIFQNISTVAGTSYRLSFYLAGNTGGGPTVKTAIVSAGAASATYTFDTTGHSNADMGWTLQTLNFTGTGNDRIQFAGQDNTFYGAALDDVSVTALGAAVPEPGSVALLAGISMTGAGVFTRRRRQVRCAEQVGSAA